MFHAGREGGHLLVHMAQQSSTGSREQKVSRFRKSQVQTLALSPLPDCLAFESLGFLISVMEMKSLPRGRKCTMRLVFSLEKNIERV